MFFSLIWLTSIVLLYLTSDSLVFELNGVEYKTTTKSLIFNVELFSLLLATQKNETYFPSDGIIRWIA
jgi:hypothetical protein